MEDATHGVSSPRNELLFSNGIHLLPYTGAGSGLTRAKFYTPDIKFENDERLKEFVVTIWRESDEVSVEASVEGIEDKGLNINGLSGEGDVSDKTSVEAGVEGEKHSERIPYAKLPGVQKNIIQYCSIPRSAREILAYIGYSNHSKNVLRFITPLLDMGYLEPTEPDKPKSPKQKYRKKQK